MTNQDDKSHGFTARAGLKGEELVGYAEKDVADLAAGQTRTVKLIAVSAVGSFDRVQVSMASVIR